MTKLYPIIIIIVAFTSGCRVGKYTSEYLKYSNIVVGRLIKSGSVEIRQLTEHVTVDVIIDEYVKGKLNTQKRYYPSGNIDSHKALLCFDHEANCELQDVGNFEYFNNDYNLNADALIITSDQGNELFDYVILFCNDRYSGHLISVENRSKIYNLATVNFVKIPNAMFKNEMKKLKRMKKRS